MTKSIFAKALLITCCLFSFLAINAQDNPWKLKAEKEGITIYSRSVDHSRIKELKMTTSVKTTLGALITILDDVTRYPEWMYGCKGGEQVNSEKESVPFYMTTIQFPKPLSWRVMFSRNIIEQDPISKAVTLKTVAVKNDDFDNDDFVVMEDIYSSWKLTPTENGEIQIESYLFCDPSGNIPFWLVNSLLDRGPLKTIQRLMKRLKEEEFADAKVEGIIE
ncbi:MAG: START domain-containing protein [Saprospiraceae bacterium]